MRIYFKHKPTDSVIIFNTEGVFSPEKKDDVDADYIALQLQDEFDEGLEQGKFSTMIPVVDFIAAHKELEYMKSVREKGEPLDVVD